MCLENNFKDFAANDMKRIELNRYIYDFSVDQNIFDNVDIIILLTFINIYLKKLNRK